MTGRGTYASRERVGLTVKHRRAPSTEPRGKDLAIV